MTDASAGDTAEGPTVSDGSSIAASAGVTAAAPPVGYVMASPAVSISDGSSIVRKWTVRQQDSTAATTSLIAKAGRE